MRKEQTVKPKNRREQRVLNFCNSCRAKIGLRPRTKLRKGRSGSARCCIIAVTISQEIGDIYVGPNYISNIGDPGKKNPEFITKFIKDFDQGKFPHLEI